MGFASTTEAKDALRERGKRPDNALAFAVTSSTFCLATDPLTDALVNKLLIGWYAKRKGITISPHSHSFWEILKGEGIGDLAAIPVLVGVERLLPGPMRALKKLVDTVAQPLYNFFGPRAIADWAKKHNVGPGDERYEARLQEWKQEQDENIARSMVMITTSTIGSWLYLNYDDKKHAADHHGHDHVPLWVLGVGKIIGSFMTYGIIVGARGAFPKQSHKVDRTLNSWFNAVYDKVSRVVGGGKAKADPAAADAASASGLGYDDDDNDIAPATRTGVGNATGQAPAASSPSPYTPPVTMRKREQPSYGARVTPRSTGRGEVPTDLLVSQAEREAKRREGAGPEMRTVAG